MGKWQGIAKSLCLVALAYFGLADSRSSRVIELGPSSFLEWTGLGPKRKPSNDYQAYFPPLPSESSRFDLLLMIDAPIHSTPIASQLPGHSVTSGISGKSTARNLLFDLVSSNDSLDHTVTPKSYEPFELKVSVAGAPHRRALQFRWQGLPLDRSSGTLSLERIPDRGKPWTEAIIPPDAGSTFELAIDSQRFTFWERIQYRLKWEPKGGIFDSSNRAEISVDAERPLPPSGLNLTMNEAHADPVLNWNTPFSQAGDQLHIETRSETGAWSHWKALYSQTHEIDVDPVILPKEGSPIKFRMQVTNGPLSSDYSEELALDAKTLAALRSEGDSAGRSLASREHENLTSPSNGIVQTVAVTPEGIDTSTQGAWAGVYGSQGVFAPSNLKVQKSDDSLISLTSAFSLAELVPGTATPTLNKTNERSSLAWASQSELSFDIKLNSSEPTQVSLALLPSAVVKPPKKGQPNLVAATQVLLTAVGKEDLQKKYSQVINVSPDSSGWVRLDVTGSVTLTAKPITANQTVLVGMLTLDPGGKNRASDLQIKSKKTRAQFISKDKNGLDLIGPYLALASITWTGMDQAHLRWSTVPAPDIPWSPKDPNPGAKKGWAYTRYQRPLGYESFPSGFDFAYYAFIQDGMHPNTSFKRQDVGGYTAGGSTFVGKKGQPKVNSVYIAMPLPGVGDMAYISFPNTGRHQITVKAGVAGLDQIFVPNHRKLPSGICSMRFTVLDAKTFETLSMVETNDIGHEGLFNLTFAVDQGDSAILFKVENTSPHGVSGQDCYAADTVPPGTLGFTFY